MEWRRHWWFEWQVMACELSLTSLLQTTLKFLKKSSLGFQKFTCMNLYHLSRQEKSYWDTRIKTGVNDRAVVVAQLNKHFTLFSLWRLFFTLQLILVSITYAYLYCDVYILYQHVYTKQFLALTLKSWLHYLLIPGTLVTLRADRKINQNTELGLIDQIITKMHNRSSCGQQWHNTATVPLISAGYASINLIWTNAF